jgi:uncharacterized protein
MGKSKVFRDSVHGYIPIDEDIVEKYIDTPQFQRLKRIKQTNLDVIFPTANHTRFDHSLGVYFLGCRLFNSIFDDCPEKYKTELKKYEYTIKIACLLHDIGHAPMSHIGEAFYDKAEIVSELQKYGITVGADVSLHEMMSVLVAIKVFGTELLKNKYDKDLFFRLITGSRLVSEGCKRKPLTKLRRAIISILSSPFDVDKMDYIMRDAANAGVLSKDLDIERIIKSASLKEDNEHGLNIAFGKAGFGVVTSIVDNRNYMHNWIYGHHKVQYQYHIITNFIRYLREIKQFKKLFSFKAITGTSVAFQNYKVSFTDDYDLWHIFKNIQLKGKKIKILREQLFNRNHYESFWKTKIEYDQAKNKFEKALNFIIKTLNESDTLLINKIRTNLKSLKKDDLLIFKSEPKIVLPDLSSNVFFYLLNKDTDKYVLKKYSDLFPSPVDKSKEDKFMFHVFIKKEKSNISNYKKIINVFSGF